MRSESNHGVDLRQRWIKLRGQSGKYCAMGDGVRRMGVFRVSVMDWKKDWACGKGN